MFVCPSCGETRNSKKALKRHKRFHDRRAIDQSLDPARSLIDSTLVIVPKPTSGAEKSCTAVETCQVLDVAGTKDQLSSLQCRRLIDMTVAKLKKQHQRDRTYLSQSTTKLTEDLFRSCEVKGLPTEVFLAVVVTAKHFAGTLSPRRPAVKRAQLRLSGTLATKSIKRQLFAEQEELSETQATKSVEQQMFTGSEELPEVQSTESAKQQLFQEFGELATQSKSSNDEIVAAILLSPVDFSKSVEIDDPLKSADDIQSKSMFDDDDWSIGVWKCYGTEEIAPPQMGYAWSPSVALGNSYPPEVMTPPSQWSLSGDDEIMGPYSPELLESNDQPVRTVKKRRHPCRPLPADLARVEEMPQTKQMMMMDWDLGCCRPMRPEDVKLPSPPCYNDQLLRTRRVLLKTKKLPRGCRIQPSRRTKNRQLNSERTELPEDVFTSSIQPEASIAIDIVLNISDDEL